MPIFNHRDVVLGLDFQQHEWQAEVIVEVPFRLMHFQPGGKNVGNGFLGRGFARRAGNPYQGLPQRRRTQVARV
jgi:hypothetical protein